MIRRLYFLCLLFCALLCGFTTDVRANAFEDPGARSGQTGGTGDLVPTEAQIQGGNISIGSTAQVVVLFRNDSGRPIQAGAIQLYPSSTVSAAVAQNQCSQGELPASATCVVSVSIKGLQAGAWRVELIMLHSGRSRLTRATLIGNVDAGAGGANRFISDLESIPNELDFGDLETAQPVIRGVVLRNVTSDPIDIAAIYVEAAERAGYSLKTDCTHLEAGQACIIVVTWSPVLAGQATGVLLVEHTGPTRVASINLDGTFEPSDSQVAATFPQAVPGKGLLVASQNQIDFGGGIATTSAITVSLVNVGDAPMAINDIRLANSDNGLSIGKSGCGKLPIILDPVEACPLTLAWSPVREGAILDDIQVIHEGARGILVLPVRGSADATISQDNKAVRLAGGGSTTASLAPGDSPDQDIYIVRDDNVDPASVLDGFTVTSHSPTRSIISGPGGSRIVFNGEEVVIGGFLWNVNIRASGVEFRSGNEKVLLLFDRSLSSVNRNSPQSGRAPAAAATPAASQGSNQ